jgi:hypothetical protein
MYTFQSKVNLEEEPALSGLLLIDLHQASSLSVIWGAFFCFPGVLQG